MGLSEEEQRQLEELERQLAQSEPHLDEKLRSFGSRNGDVRWRLLAECLLFGNIVVLIPRLVAMGLPQFRLHVLPNAIHALDSALVFVAFLSFMGFFATMIILIVEWLLYSPRKRFLLFAIASGWASLVGQLYLYSR